MTTAGWFLVPRPGRTEPRRLRTIRRFASKIQLLEGAIDARAGHESKVPRSREGTGIMFSGLSHEGAKATKGTEPKVDASLRPSVRFSPCFPSLFRCFRAK